MVAHDAEGTVRRAVESLQNQTFGNFELIVVDAGSEDATPRLLDAIAERDMRVSVVRAETSGRIEALNLALSRARGTYVLMAEASAWADPAMLAGLVSVAEAGSLELVVGGFTVCVPLGGGRSSRAEVASDEEVFPTQHDFRATAWRLLAKGQLLPVAGKLFLRERLERLDLRFAPDRRNGHSFVTAYLADVERVGVAEGAHYHVERPLSVLRSRSALDAYRRLEEEHSSLLALFRRWGLDGDAASVEALQDRYVEQLVSCVEDVCGRGSRVPASDQRRLVAQMIETDRAQLAASIAHPQGNAARALLAPIRAHNSALVCVQTRLISLFRRGVADVTPDAFI